jgi:hypothetical protein
MKENFFTFFAANGKLFPEIRKDRERTACSAGGSLTGQIV